MWRTGAIRRSHDESLRRGRVGQCSGSAMDRYSAVFEIECRLVLFPQRAGT